jgi:hypothetical protein
MDFALSEIDTKTGAEAGVEVAFKNLKGEPLLNAKKEPVGVTVLGSDSKAYRAGARDLTRRRIDRAQKSKGKPLSDDMLDAAEKDDIELLVGVTTGWFGVLDTKDKPIEFSKEGVRELYAKYPVAAEQANEAVLDRTRFIKPSSEG